MINISNKMQKYTLKVAIVAYLADIIVIILYYFNIESDILKVFSSILSFIVFPIFFMAIIINNQKSDNNKKNEIDYLSYYSNLFSGKPSWLQVALTLTAIYSFVSFFYVVSHTSIGVPVIENGEYFARNHSKVVSITKEKFDELSRFENLREASSVLFFYIISIWIMYKKDYYIN